MSLSKRTTLALLAPPTKQQRQYYPQPLTLGGRSCVVLSVCYTARTLGPKVSNFHLTCAANARVQLNGFACKCCTEYIIESCHITWVAAWSCARDYRKLTVCHIVSSLHTTYSTYLSTWLLASESREIDLCTVACDKTYGTLT